MNCPICGAPLGATDNECKNCGTRRAEMGAAYNNQQNSYGYGGNQGYGNYGMDQSFGNSSFTRTQSRSADPRKLILTLVAVLVLLLTFFVYQMNYNSEHKESFGDISITFPQKLKADTTSVFDGIGADESYTYSNRNMKFACLKKNFGVFSLKNENKEEMYNLIFPVLNENYEKSMKNYEKKDQVDNHLRFYCDIDGEKNFCDMMIDLKDEDCYVYIACCEAENENKFISKFRKMYDSIEYDK